MIVAISGASGFIGSQLAKRHMQLGDEVRYLTRRNSRPIDNAIAFIGDVNSPVEQLLPFLHGAHVFYHCAAEISNEEEMVRINVEGTANLIKVASLAKVGTWVQLSSTGVYGNQSNKVVTETTTPYPSNCYEKTKLEADALVLAASNTNSLKALIIRPSNVYGRTMKNKSLFGLIEAIKKGYFFFIGKKGAIVNYIHIDNVVNAMVLAVGAKNIPNGSTYIISDFCTIESFVESICRAMGINVPRLRVPELFIRLLVSMTESINFLPLTISRIDALTQRTIFSSDKIISELGYTHVVGICQGIADLTEHYNQTNNL